MARRVAATLLLAAVAAGCSGAPTRTGPPSPAPAEPAPSAPTGAAPTSTPADAATPPRPTAGVTVTTGRSDFGEILYDASGQAIYIWEVEASSQPKCYDDCAEAWPPVLTDGEPVASGSVDPALLGTVARADGSTQVTYAGHPLYFYAHEGKREVRCHNVATHGGLWWVVTPRGTPAE